MPFHPILFSHPLFMKLYVYFWIAKLVLFAAAPVYGVARNVLQNRRERKLIERKS
jgi:hypothetical protein